MAAEGVNITEDTEMAECDGDKVVTMMDVLQEQQDFEEDANAVLGASDDKNCTYAKGYIKRQALYACLTCCPDVKTDPTKRAGLCLACSLNCHESHELVELYTKRNFRCDCGNPNFNSHPCQFTSDKDDFNNDNIYNQNFSGVYCTCHRPYPDPDPNFDEDMIQCIICEDWLHVSHLDAVVPANDQYSEMICKGCMEKNQFLHDYSNLTVNVESVDIITVNGNHNDDHSVCNGDVTTTVSVPNGGDVEMADNNKTNSELQLKNTQNLEVTDKTDDLSGNSTKEQELNSTEAKEIIDSVKDIEPSSTSIEHENDSKENDITHQSETNKDTAADDNLKYADDSIMNTSDNLMEKESKTQTDDNKTDMNKTEDQLLDDITDALTSDKPSEELKSSIAETPAGDGKINDIVNNSKTEGVESTEKKPLEETNECNNENVPDTSQETSVKDNVDDKTDDIMNAIDAFLESTTETKPTEHKESNEETSEKLKEGGETQVPDDQHNDTELEKDENITIDKSQKADISVEMTDNPEKDISTTEEKETQETDVTKGDITEADNTSVLKGEEKSKDNTSADEDIVTSKRKLSITEESSPKKVKLDVCVKPKGVKKVYKGATFWPSNFRQKLCTCAECISMYKDLNVLFLTDLEDTVAFYEGLGKNNVDGLASQYEKGLQALSSLDRIQQINALTEYNKMRDKLVDYLKSFQDRKEIVKEEDIRAFFADIKAKREPDGVYFCR